jgi:hypothetical protein
MIIEAPNLKAMLQNDAIRYYIESDNRFINECQGYVICCLGRVVMNENNLEKSPIYVKQFIGSKVKLNEFLSKFYVGQKKLINGAEHVLVAIDIHIHEDEFNKRINTSKFVAELNFNVTGDKNDYRYI